MAGVEQGEGNERLPLPVFEFRPEGVGRVIDDVLAAYMVSVVSSDGNLDVAKAEENLRRTAVVLDKVVPLTESEEGWIGYIQAVKVDRLLTTMEGILPEIVRSDPPEPRDL